MWVKWQRVGALLVVGLLLAGGLEAFSTEFLHQFSGGQVVEMLGDVVASAGDVNGDGYEDFLITAPGKGVGSDTGVVYVYFGGPTLDVYPDVVIVSPFPDAWFATSAAGVGDLNGDGYDDIAVGAPRADLFLGEDEGYVYIYFGGTAMDSLHDHVFTGEKVGSLFGTSVAGAGDVNGDGYDDLIVGAKGYADTVGTTIHHGAAYLFLGRATLDTTYDLILVEGNGTDEFGTSVAGAGDVNGDGYDDFLVGDPRFTRSVYGNTVRGGVWLYYGAFFVDDEADAVIWGDTTWSGRIGSSVAGIGDVNGDGWNDIATGGTATSASGSVFLFYGPVNGFQAVYKGEYSGRLSMGQSGDYFGGWISPGRDINGDGFDDFLVGSPRQDSRVLTDNGAVYGFLGGPYLNTPAFQIVGILEGEEMGSSVALVDYDRDGEPEVLTGSPLFTEDYRGRACLYEAYLYRLLSPTGGETWTVGTRKEIRWKGGDDADLYLSLDGGHSWQLIASDVEGFAPPETVEYTFLVPQVPTRYALVRVVKGGYSVLDPDNYVQSDTFFTINATITLLAFNAETGEEGKVRLSWQTDPGPEDLVGYHVYRLNADGTETRLTAEPIQGQAYEDEATAGVRGYALGAVNGLGTEYRLGEVLLGALTDPVQVLPTLVRGQANLFFAVPAFYSGASTVPVRVELFNAAGQRVRRLLQHPLTPGIHQLTFSTEALTPGVYFAVVQVGTGYRHTARFQVLHR